MNIEELKQEFCALLRRVGRPNANIDGLINKLEELGFFESPASTKYHNSMPGGLVSHSLNVYHNLNQLVNMKHLTDDIPEDSIIICSLLHDLSKAGLYEKVVKNKKVYHEGGSKYDEMGRFDWQSVASYATKDVSERFLYGSHEETSEFMIRNYIPLTLSESIAVLHHHGGMGFDSSQVNLSPIYNRHSLAILLHTADMLATYVDEKDTGDNE